MVCRGEKKRGGEALFPRVFRLRALSATPLPPIQSATAIRAGLIEAKIDAINHVIHVSRAGQTTFTDQQWIELRTVLQDWKQNVSEVKRVLEDVKVQVKVRDQREHER